MKRLLLIVLFITGIANAQTTYLQVGNTLQQKDTTINAVSQKTYRTVKGSTGYEYFPTRGWVLSREWAISRVTGLQDALDAKLPLSAGQFNRLTGGLYMNNNLYIYGRNVGNTANLRLFGLSDTDQLWLDPDGIGVNFGWNIDVNGNVEASTFNGSALGSAAYKNSSSGHNSSNTLVERDVSGKGGLEDLYLGSGYNDWMSTILTGKASTTSLDNYLLKTGGTLTGALTGTSATFSNAESIKINNNVGYISFNDAAGATQLGYLQGASSSNQLNLFTTGATPIQIGTNGTTALTIASNQAATFVSTVGVADATASGHAVNKGQLDASDANNVKLTGDQTVAGIKTFSSEVITNSDATVKGDVFIWSGNGAQAGFISSYDGGGGLNIQASGTNESVRLVPTGTGKVRLSGDVVVTDAPTTSAGTYDILTRNTSTGVTEKIASSSIPTMLSMSTTIDIPSLSPGANYTIDIAFTGVESSDPIVIGLPPGVATGGGLLSFSAFYSAANQITFTAYNMSTSTTINIASATYKFKALK